MKAGSIHIVLGMLIALGTMIAPAGAQNFASVPDTISFRHIYVEHGLSENRVYDVIQDIQGFIWFGTRGGLNRYDGRDIIAYKHRSNDASSLSSNFVWKIHEDRNGFLWTGPSNGGSSRFDPISEIFLQMRPSWNETDKTNTNSVWDIIDDPDGGVWASVIDEGLEYRDPKSGEVKRFRHDPNNPRSLSQNVPSRLMFDKTGRFWVGTYGGGLNLFDPQSATAVRFRHDPEKSDSLINDFIWAMIEDRRGMLWIGTDGGLSLFDPDKRSFRNFRKDGPEGFTAGQALSLLEDSNGLVWVGTKNSGIFVYNPETNRFRQFSHDDNIPDSLSNNTVFDIFQDRDGGYWFATENGVNYFSPKLRRFGQVHGASKTRPEEGLSVKSVNAFYEDEKGKIWVGTDGGGLNVYDPGTKKFKSFRHIVGNPSSLSSDMISAMEADSKGTLWIGTSNGLNAFSPRTGRTVPYYKNSVSNQNLNTKNIYSLTVDQRDRIWLASYGEGIIRLDPASGQVKNFTSAPDDGGKLNFGLASDVVADQSKRIWVGTEFGLIKIDAETDAMTGFFNADNDATSLSSNIVNAIYEDSDQRIWVGTDDGVNLYNETSNKFRRYFTNNELPSNVINEIREDNIGNIWLSTANGLVRFNPKTSKPPQVFDKSDGLQGTQFGRNAALKASDGTLYFGGRNGFNRFHPNQFKESDIQPPVKITDIRLFNKSIKVGTEAPLGQSARHANSITFDHTQSVFSFQFAALDYTAPSKILYKYKLEGFDQDWVETKANNRLATYTNLDPGNYDFKVRATNSDGIWSSRSASMAVIVLPPWWATSGFRAAAVFAVLSLLFGGYRWRVQAIHNRTILLQELVDKRNLDLKISNERYFSLFDHIPSGVILYESNDNGKSFRTFDLNQAAEKILNINRAQVIDTTFDNTPPLLNDGAELQEKLRRVYASGKFEHSTPIKVNRDGCHYWFEHFVYRLENKQVVEVISDITDHIDTSEALEAAKNKAEGASNAKTAFLAQISHEIRTPLSAILGTTHLLGKSTLNETQERLIQTLGDSGELLLSILDEILDISRIEAGHLALENVSFDLTELVERVGTAMRANANAKGIDLVADTTGLPPAVVGDPVRLRQILFNLVGNAVKFTEKGRITISVIADREIYHDGGAGSTPVHFTITDSGIGIAPGQLQTIFEPFAQEDIGTARRYGGSGLGLSISQRLVEEMGGEIGVESEKGEGSSFWFVIDLASSHDNPVALANDGMVRPPALSILLVDDIADTREVTAMLLESEGHRIVQAGSGPDAIGALLADEDIDLVLMDIRMPDMDGAEAVKAIRRLPDAEERRTPVFAFTADASPESRVIHKDAGMDATVTKPLRLDVFNQVLVDFFGGGGTGRSRPFAVSDSASTLLDHEILSQFQNIIGIEGLRNQFNKFKVTGDRLIRDINLANSVGDMAAISWHVHQLSGAAGTIGFRELARKAIRIETITESQRPRDIDEDLNQIVEIQEKSIQAFEEYIGNIE